MKSKSKRRKGLKAKKYNLGGYLNPTDPPKYESKASVPPRDYTLREYDTGVDSRGPFIIIGGEKVYGEQPLQAVYNPLSPAQDARDIASGVMKFPQSPTEGLTEIALGAIGAVPILGDIAKSVLRPVFGRSAKGLMWDYAEKGGTPFDIFSKDVMNQDVIGVYTDEARNVTKRLFDEEADRLIKIYGEESLLGAGRVSANMHNSSRWIESFETATKPLTDREIAALKKDINIANSGDGYVNLSRGRMQGYNSDFDMIPSDVLSDRLEAVGKSDEWYLDPVLAKYFGSGAFNATDAYKEVLDGSLNLPRQNVLERIHGNTAISPTIIKNKDLRNTALASAGVGTAAAGGYAYANMPQAYRNAINRKLGLPQDLPALASTEEKYVDLSNRRLGYVETIPGQTPDIEANLILGGEFVEGSQSSDTVKDAIDYKNTQGSVKLPSIGGEIDFDAQSGDYYGVQDGKLVVGGINSFNDDTRVVPLRYSAKNISEARVENGRFRIVDQSGKPIYQNITKAGKIILYSPETGKSAFFYSSSPEKSVDFTNKFLSDNNGSAIPVVIDNGRYQYYMDTKDQGTMSGADYGDYIKNDMNRPYRHGYNITAYDKGGRLKVLKRGKKGALSSLVKNYNLGGYLDPNGDPTKKPGKAVAESTAVPNYTEQAFLNYARLLPQVQTPYFRHEGTIRPTPENEPSFLQSIWEGTLLGQTEDERMAPPDQMSLLDVMAEPLKALEYYSFDANRGRLPTRAEWDSFGSPNPMDNALFMYNPAAQISFAQEDEAGGLSAFTGIGKIGNVVRDAFNTGDDILRISAENISKQGQKMTQKHLAQQINKSPLVDLEEAVYNPEIISIATPGFGISSRNLNSHYLGQPGGRLATQLQKQHAEDYGIRTDEFALRNRDDFNITKDGNDLPITRSISYGGVLSSDVNTPSEYYEPGAFISGSVPQIRPLQAGGELEKFVKKDGTINLNEVSNFVSTSKSISPADRFILNQAISKMDVNQPYDYNQFKGNVSQYIPRMTVRSADEFSAQGVQNIFPDHGPRDYTGVLIPFDDPDPTKFTAEAVVISESNLPAPITSNAGNQMENYMLNSDTDMRMHYDPVKDSNDNTLGSHSHYRVVRLSDQPEVSYFLEVQSDALVPSGFSNYNNMINEGKNPLNSAIPKLTPANIGQWHIDDLSGQQLTRNRTPLGVLQLLRRDYGYYPDYYPNEFADIIRENKDVFPIGADGMSTFSDEDLDRFNFITQKKAEKLFQQLGPDQFNKVFDNSIEPRVIDYHDKFLTPTGLYDGLSPLQFNITNIGNHMNNIREMLNPDGKFMMEAKKSPEAYQNAINELKNRYKDASFQVSETFEKVEELKNYLDYRAQDFIDFNDNIKDFLQEYDDILLHNSYLDGLQIDRGDFLKLDRIRQEVRELTREAGVANLDLIMLQNDVENISKALDFYDADVFPLKDTQLGLTTAFSDQQDKLNNIGWRVEGLTTGKHLLTGLSFKEVAKNLPDLKPLADRYNRLIEDFEKELKIFRDKYLPVLPGGMENPVSQLMKKRPERRIIGEALHGPHNNLYNRFPTEETSRKIQGHPAIGEQGSKKYDAVQKKYKNMEKTLKAMGYEPKLVTDSYGNTWWEVKATAGMIHGTAEYDAYWKGGRIGLKKKRNSMIRLVKR